MGLKHKQILENLANNNIKKYIEEGYEVLIEVYHQCSPDNLVDSMVSGDLKECLGLVEYFSDHYVYAHIVK